MISNTESLLFFKPELVLTAAALLLVCTAALKPLLRSSRSIPSLIAVGGLVLSLYLTAAGFGETRQALFMGMFLTDRHSEFFKIVFAVAALIVIMFSRKSAELCGRKNGSKQISASFSDDHEYYALILGMVIGLNLLASTTNILMIYLSLEFVGLVSYLLTAYSVGFARSGEAGLKYALFGAVASGIFLFGASILYGVSGSLDISSYASAASGLNLVFTAAGVLVLCGLLFKIAAVPMQAWCPDAYEGAPTPVTALLSVAPKAAGFAILMRFAALAGASFSWPAIIAIVSAVTMTFGNLAALTQPNAKRMLAYSSIAHAGYILMGIACFTPKGNEAVYFYFIAYLIMNLGAFFVVQLVANSEGSDDISAMTGLGHMGAQGAFAGVCMTVFLLSLTGIPPFVGFIGKFYLFSAVIDANIWWLAIVGILNSVVSLYYYMRIVKTIFMDSPASQESFRIDGKWAAVLMAALAILTIIFGLFWSQIAGFASFTAFLSS